MGHAGQEAGQGGDFVIGHVVHHERAELAVIEGCERAYADMLAEGLVGVGVCAVCALGVSTQGELGEGCSEGIQLSDGIRSSGGMGAGRIGSGTCKLDEHSMMACVSGCENECAGAYDVHISTGRR